MPRADPTLALRVLRREAPLGRGVWVLDASERNNIRPRLEIERRLPKPAAPYDVRVFGPFLVIRTLNPVVTPRAFLYYSARALLVGQQLGIGDADVNLQTVVLAAACRPGLRALASLPLEQLAVARSALERCEPGLHGAAPPTPGAPEPCCDRGRADDPAEHERSGPMATTACLARPLVARHETIVGHARRLPR